MAYYYDGRTSDIPSVVVDLPRPALRPQQRWAAVQPSPDRSSVLLRGEHECQLLRLRSPRTGASAFPATQSSSGVLWSRVVLPQPHRCLSASCWVSAGTEEAGAGDGGDVSCAASLGAVVAVGDCHSTVSVMRATHGSSQGGAPPITGTSMPGRTGGEVEWTQSTIFLYDSRTQLTTAAATASSSSSSAGAAPLSRWWQPSWKAVATVVPSHYLASTTTAADVSVVCQRSCEEPYESDGAAHASARVSRHAVWVASVRRESAARVPLVMPHEEEEEGENDEGPSTLKHEGVEGGRGGGVVAGWSAAAKRLKRESVSQSESAATIMRRDVLNNRNCSSSSSAVRIFDVQRRVAAAPEQAPPWGAHAVTFAAASRHHVGLFTATSVAVTPTVYFPLPRTQPPYLFSSAGAGPTGNRGQQRWRVTAVSEAPPLSLPPPLNAEAGDRGTPWRGAMSSSPFAYLVTATCDGRPSCWLGSAEKRESWWLLYDCRRPSAPVWAAKAPQGCADAPPHDDAGLCDSRRCREAGEGGASMSCHPAAADLQAAVSCGTEWLCSEAPSDESSGSYLCATYVPPPQRTAVKTQSAGGGDASCARRPATSGLGGQCVVLDAGSMPAPTALREEAEERTAPNELSGMHATEGTAEGHPLVFALEPPQSLSGRNAQPQRRHVRAVAYHNHVLTYLCES